MLRTCGILGRAHRILLSCLTSTTQQGTHIYSIRQLVQYIRLGSPKVLAAIVPVLLLLLPFPSLSLALFLSRRDAGFNPGDEGRTEPTAIHPPTEIPPA